MKNIKSYNFEEGCAKILNLSTVEIQRLKWLEELGELTQAISKGKRESIIEEMADVYICLGQIELCLNVEPLELANTIKYKINRTIERLGGGEHGSD